VGRPYGVGGQAKRRIPKGRARWPCHDGVDAALRDLMLDPRPQLITEQIVIAQTALGLVAFDAVRGVPAHLPEERPDATMQRRRASEKGERRAA